MDTDQLRSRRLRLALISVGLLIAGFVLFLVFSALQHKGKVAVEFITAPTQATVKVNNKVVGKNTFLSPGTYNLSVEHDGFTAHQQTFELRPGDKKTKFPIALTAATEEAKQAAGSQSTAYQAVEAAGSAQAQQEGINFLKENPIVQNIPFKTSYYSIDYGRDGSGNFLVQITASSPLGRQAAIEKIRSWGFEPTDYRIEFIGLANPFNTGVRP